MANFTPNGIIHIGNVPFTNNYLNVRLFDTATAQETYMLSCMTRSLDNNTYTYVRLNNAIRVQGNAEDLYTYDYCMFKNANYGNKWFYAFITEVRYINENVTEFQLELDVMQTWMFDYTLRQGFVEREHTNDDTIGANLNTEPSFNYNTVIQNEYIDPDFVDQIDNNTGQIVPAYYLVTEATKGFDSTNTNKVISSVPGVYQNIFNGSQYWGLDYIAGDPTMIAEQKQYLQKMNNKGEANSIVSLFLFPKAYSPSITGRTFNHNTSPVTKIGYFTMPTTLDGYTPRNNKLFTFPYCYPAFADMNGNYKEYKFELWSKHNIPNTQTQAYLYKKQAIMDSSGELYITPQYYDGVDNNFVEAFVYKFENRISWVYNGFNNWLAQNSMRLFSQVATTAISVGTLGYASSEAERIMDMYHLDDDQKMTGIRAQRERFAVLSPRLQGINKALGTTLNIASELYSASKMPNEKRGTSSGNGRFAYNINSYSARIICLQHQFAERLDSFFDRFGYATELVKVPNIRGRQSWNFVKMQNACHYGNVPNNDMDIINSIYNRGVTFWHTNNVGDYTQSNAIVMNINPNNTPEP